MSPADAKLVRLLEQVRTWIDEAEEARLVFPDAKDAQLRAGDRLCLDATQSDLGLVVFGLDEQIRRLKAT